MKEKVKHLKKRKSAAQEWIEAILFAFVVAMVIRNYTFQNFKIPSSSMEKTLLIGDYLVANKVKYFFNDPKREDIVTFRYPADPIEPEPRDNFVKIMPPIYWNKTVNTDIQQFTLLHLTYYAKKNIVKRVIGMPGETVEIRNKIVYINGKPFVRGYECYGEPYNDQIVERTMPKDYPMIQWGDKWMGNRDWFGPVTVPAGKYFVMGDNRDVSGDSRYWGFLDRSDITGTPSVIFWSNGIEYNQLTDTPHIRWDRIFRIIK